MAILDSIKHNNKNLIFVLCGPSGVGKTSIKIRLIDQNNDLTLVPSITTRPKTIGDIGIAEYHHITYAEYERLYENGELISKKIQQFGFYYGIKISDISNALSDEDNVLLETTLWGIKQLKKYFNNVISIFVSPPSLEELKRRLQERNRENEEKIILRLNLAKQILDSFRRGMVDYHLINEDLQMSIDFVNCIIARKKIEMSSIQT
jgi:guanylate kinase